MARTPRRRCDGASLDVVWTDLGSMTDSCVLRLLTARRGVGAAN